jgi:hypothetical protein
MPTAANTRPEHHGTRTNVQGVCVCVLLRSSSRYYGCTRSTGIALISYALGFRGPSLTAVAMKMLRNDAHRCTAARHCTLHCTQIPMVCGSNLLHPARCSTHNNNNTHIAERMRLRRAQPARFRQPVDRIFQRESARLFLVFLI